MVNKNECMRKGVIYLTSARHGETVGIETTCKTRRCVACQPKLKAKMAMLVEYGISTLGHSYFITFTFVMRQSQKDAPYVRACWKKVLDFMRSKWGQGKKKKLAWIYVVELTKKNQPHLHVVMNFGTASLVAACQTRATYRRDWRERKCDCLEHVLSSVWHGITGDSFVVDCRAVSSARGDAGYLAKYFAKGLALRDNLEALGFYRSWARSNTWPGDQLHLRETDLSGWRRIEFHPGSPSEMTRDWLDNPPYLIGLLREKLLERAGTDLALALAERNANEAQLTSLDSTLAILRRMNYESD